MGSLSSFRITDFIGPSPRLPPINRIFGRPGRSPSDLITAALSTGARKCPAIGIPVTLIRSGSTPCPINACFGSSLGAMYRSTLSCAQYRCATKSVSTPTNSGHSFPVRCFHDAITPQANAWVQTTTSGWN
jgi:hypothetical protein